MLKTLLIEEIRLLAFRPVSSAINTHWRAFLAFGLLFTWLAGVGRYWDNPKAQLWQYFGLGSIAYVFVLAIIVWGLLAPLRPKNWSYRNVLLFITLTSPPAVLYAIPVEKFMAADAARTANAWFLIVVATWRVALFFVFLRRVAALTAGTVVIATLLPLVIIIIALYALNLEHVVFSLMSGVREEDRSPNDAAYGVVFLLSMLSFAAAPFLAIGYVVAIIQAWSKTQPGSRQEDAGR
ncbi:MAG: hypothetical protein HZC23_03695 [Rhodocyclales bacterium]|nr:hypothetical protein [Rhodocyclales bacterium]